jgi:hypothetical protein
MSTVPETGAPRRFGEEGALVGQREPVAVQRDR